MSDDENVEWGLTETHRFILDVGRTETLVRTRLLGVLEYRREVLAFVADLQARIQREVMEYLLWTPKDSSRRRLLALLGRRLLELGEDG